MAGPATTSSLPRCTSDREVPSPTDKENCHFLSATVYGGEAIQRIAELEAPPTTCTGSTVLFQTPFYDRGFLLWQCHVPCVFIMPSYCRAAPTQQHIRKSSVLSLHTGRLALLRTLFSMCFLSALWLADSRFWCYHIHILLDLALNGCLLLLAPFRKPTNGYLAQPLLHAKSLILRAGARSPTVWTQPNRMAVRCYWDRLWALHGSARHRQQCLQKMENQNNISTSEERVCGVNRKKTLSL